MLLRTAFICAAACSIATAAAAQFVEPLLPGDDFSNFGQAQPKKPPKPTDDCHTGQPSNFKGRQTADKDLDKWADEFKGKLGLKRPIDVKPTDCDIWLDGVDKVGFTYRNWPDRPEVPAWHPEDPAFTCMVRVEYRYIKSCGAKKKRFLLAHELCHCQQLEQKKPLDENLANDCADALVGKADKTVQLDEACTAEEIAAD